MPHINDWGIQVRGYESAHGGLYHSESVAIEVSSEVGAVHALVRFLDIFDAYEALEHILKYDGDRLGAIGLSLAKSAIGSGNVARKR